MTNAEKWRTLARVLVITIPPAMLLGAGIGWMIGSTGGSVAAGAVIGLLVTAGIVSFDVRHLLSMWFTQMTVSW